MSTAAGIHVNGSNHFPPRIAAWCVTHLRQYVSIQHVAGCLRGRCLRHGPVVPRVAPAFARRLRRDEMAGGAMSTAPALRANGLINDIGHSPGAPCCTAPMRAYVP